MHRVVLFTGGSASNLLARALEDAGIATTHVVSVFDNGGSTGKLRRIADLPAIGDVRNRLCALARSTSAAGGRMRSLFEHRLAEGASEAKLRHELDSLVDGRHPLTSGLHSPLREEVLEALSSGRAALPADFALAATSVGNLLLFGRYRLAGSFLGSIDWAASLLEVRPRVLPITLQSAHLGVELDDGEWIIGQAALTSEDPSTPRSISRLFLLSGEDTCAGAEHVVDACPEVLEAIANADAIVFGFGSFYSSILPHLLVAGVADAIVRRRAPRIFLANPTADRETDGMTLSDIIETVTDRAQSGGPDRTPFLTHVVHFSGEGERAIPTGDLSRFADSGVELIFETAPLSLEATAESAAGRVLSVLPAARTPGHAGREPGYPVALLDLDHTLYDYGSLRRGATVAALSTFCRAPEDTCDLLLEHLVTPTTHVLRELGFPDLRRQWNCAAFFAWAAILDAPETRERTLRAFREVRTAGASVQATSPFETRSGFHAIARDPGHDAGWRDLAAEALRLATHDDAGFAAQCAAFDTYVAANAALLEGAPTLLGDLEDEGVATIIVTEGDSSVQRAKIEYLGLDDLVTSTVVADRTLGAAQLVEEIFLHSTRVDAPAPHLAATYDELCRFLVKTPAFYGKLVHSLVASGPRGLEAAIEDAVFLTAEEWGGPAKPRLAAVGDRYHKDLRPLLAACTRGAAAFRVAQGKYSTEFPLHEIEARSMPAPRGHFASLEAVRTPLLEWARADGPEVSRPEPTLSRRILDAFTASADFLSPAADRTLTMINSELGRHPR